jgi:hypothetical protein
MCTSSHFHYPTNTLSVVSACLGRFRSCFSWVPFGTYSRFQKSLTCSAMLSWIATARLHYCFDIEQVAAKVIDTLEINVAELRRASFDVKVTARSEAHRKLIKRRGGEAAGVSY